MSSLNKKLNVICDEKAAAVLRRLHEESRHEFCRLFRHYLPWLPKLITGKKLPWEHLEHTHDRDYLASSPGHGIYLYLLARAAGAKRIVEFGTSFGVSTIYLALAARDNGGGLVIGTEMIPSKASMANRNIKEAGLSGYVKILEGNALDTLRNITGQVDFHFSDGFPQYALPVLKLLAPKMRQGTVVINHNAAIMKGDHAEYIDYVRNPSNGFVSANFIWAGEFSVRIRQ